MSTERMAADGRREFCETGAVRCRLALAALAAAVVLVLTACAGGGESTAGETSQAETSTGLTEDAGLVAAPATSAPAK